MKIKHVSVCIQNHERFDSNQVSREPVYVCLCHNSKHLTEHISNERIMEA